MPRRFCSLLIALFLGGARLLQADAVKLEAVEATTGTGQSLAEAVDGVAAASARLEDFAGHTAVRGVSLRFTDEDGAAAGLARI